MNLTEEKGFTLLEIIISLSIILLIMSSIFYIYSWVVETYTFSENITRRQNSIENIVYYINEDMKEGIDEIKEKEISFNNGNNIHLKENKIYHNNRPIFFNASDFIIDQDGDRLKLIINDHEFIFAF